MSIFLYVKKQERKRGIFMLLNSIVAVVIIVIAIFTVKKYKMSMKYGCCGSADSGEGRRVEVADKNPDDYPYTAVLDIKGMTCENCVRYVENALNEQGDIWAVADLKRNSAFVRMKKEYTDDQFKMILRPTGYTLVGVRDRNKNK